mmetsp:Transcript_35065/g.82054  ORF Transcript_35065/g.82054 Transcript_35065/m.82054 type:complete len:261 (-) Transcript_35065:998-1780(-)
MLSARMARMGGGARKARSGTRRHHRAQVSASAGEERRSRGSTPRSQSDENNFLTAFCDAPRPCRLLPATPAGCTPPPSARRLHSDYTPLRTDRTDCTLSEHRMRTPKSHALALKSPEPRAMRRAAAASEGRLRRTPAASSERRESLTASSREPHRLPWSVSSEDRRYCSAPSASSSAASSARSSSSRAIFPSCVFSSATPCAFLAFRSSICLSAFCNFFLFLSASPCPSPDCSCRTMSPPSNPRPISSPSIKGTAACCWL